MKALFRTPLVALLLLFVVASGCYTVRYSIPSEHQAASYNRVGSFSVQKKASWVIFGLVPLSDAQVEEVVRREVEKAGGDAATNITITAQYDVVDVLVAAIVGGLFNTRTYTVEGDVVRFNRSDLGAMPEGSRSVILGQIKYQTATQP